MIYRVTRPDSSTYTVSIPDDVDSEQALAKVLGSGDTWSVQATDDPDPGPQDPLEVLTPRQFQWFCLASPLGEAIDVAAQYMLQEGLKARRATYLLKGTEKPSWTFSEASALALEVSGYLAGKEVSMDLSENTLRGFFEEAMNV